MKTGLFVAYCLTFVVAKAGHLDVHEVGADEESNSSHLSSESSSASKHTTGSSSVWYLSPSPSSPAKSKDLVTSPHRRSLLKTKNSTLLSVPVFHEFNNVASNFWNNTEFKSAFRRKKPSKTTTRLPPELECEYPPRSETDMRHAKRVKRLTTMDGLACLEDYPYTASIRVGGRHFCGGALVSDEWVLSAGLCFDGIAIREVSVRLGSVFRDYGGYLYSVVLMKRHPDYHTTSTAHNLAMMKLNLPVKVSLRVRPVTLPTPFSEMSDYPYIGEVVVSGYGSTSSDNIRLGFNQELRKMVVSDVSDKECKVTYKNEFSVQRDHVCLKSVTPGIALCAGDIGDPAVLFTNSNREGTLVGIALYSGNEGCSLKKRPAIYTKVSYNRVWIENLIKGKIDISKTRKNNLIINERPTYRPNAKPVLVVS